MTELQVCMEFMRGIHVESSKNRNIAIKNTGLKQLLDNQKSEDLMINLQKGTKNSF